MSQTDLNGADIITAFELQVDDITELSAAEELNLLNDKYMDVCSERPWEFLKKSATGALTLDSTTGLYYITKPTDFAFFAENNAYTDNAIEIENNAKPCVVFIGANYAPYQIVNYSDRVQYRTHSNVCYLDLTADKIYFPKAPSDTSFYQFDYIRVPDLLTTSTTPVFPNRFRKMLWFAMATDNDILQKSPKATSYAAENRAKYNDTLEKMSWWNDQHYMN